MIQWICENWNDILFVAGVILIGSIAAIGVKIMKP